MQHESLSLLHYAAAYMLFKFLADPRPSVLPYDIPYYILHR